MLISGHIYSKNFFLISIDNFQHFYECILNRKANLCINPELGALLEEVLHYEAKNGFGACNSKNSLTYIIEIRISCILAALKEVLLP